MRKGKIRWGAIANAVVGVIALAGEAIAKVNGSPEILGMLPPALVHAVAIGTLINATFIKPAVRSETERRKP